MEPVWTSSFSFALSCPKWLSYSAQSASAHWKDSVCFSLKHSCSFGVTNVLRQIIHKNFKVIPNWRNYVQSSPWGPCPGSARGDRGLCWQDNESQWISACAQLLICLDLKVPVSVLYGVFRLPYRPPRDCKLLYSLKVYLVAVIEAVLLL